MKDHARTKKQLIDELTAAHRQISQLEKSMAGYALKMETQRSPKLLDFELTKRDRYLETIIEIQQHLFNLAETENDHAKVLQLLGGVSSANRVYIFKNSRDAVGNLLMSQVAEWTIEGVKSELDNDLLQNLPYADGFERLQALLANGDVYSGIVSKFPKSERSILEPQDIQAILILPLFVNHEFWGFIGFDNCETAREWTRLEVNLLRSAASSIAAYEERYLAFQALQLSHKTLLTILDNLDANIYVVDMKTYEILFVNKSMQEMFGDVKGKICWQVFQQAQKGPCQFCTNNKLLTTAGKPAGIINREFQNTVDKRWYTLADSAIEWIDGRTVRMEIAFDITERKQAEKALQESQARYKSMYRMFCLMADNMPDLMWAKDMDRRFLFVNKALCEKLLQAKNTDEPVGKDDLFFALRERNSAPHSAQWHTFGEICADSDTVVMKNRRAERFDEFGNVRGEFLYLDVYKAPFWDENGKMIGTVGCGRVVTREKEIEKKLLESEKRYRALFNQAADSIMLIHCDTCTVVEFNERAHSHLGYSREEFKKLKLIDFYVARSAKEINEHCRKIIRDGAKTYEIKIKTRQGLIQDVLISARHISLSGVDFIQCIIRDITEQKQMEDALQKSEAQFRALSEAAFEAIFLSENGICLGQNLTAEQMFGYTLAEAIGQPGTMWIVPQARKSVKNNMLTGYEAPYQAIALRKDGSTFPAEIQGKIMYYQGREVRVTALRDISRQVQVEDSLRKLEKAIETTQLGVTINNMQGNIVYTNPADAEMHGYKVNELVGKSVNTYAPAELKKPVKLKDIEGSAFYVRESINIRKDGSTFPVWLTSAIVKDSTGKPDAIVTICEDITLRKQNEAALKQAKEAAEMANQAKSEFLTNMSHELRTPLNGVLGYAQLLSQDNNLTPSQLEKIATIQNSGQHLLTLINDILDLSKIEMGKLKIEPIIFHLTGSLQSIIDINQPRARQQGISLTYEVDAQLHILVYGDETRLRQIILNLIGNAIKFTQKGQVILRISEQQRSKSAKRTGSTILSKIRESQIRRIRFEVEDTGIGISPGQQKNIFLPFEQMKALRTEGVGLGLAISQRLASMMGSQLQMESSPEKGSRFWFDLDLPECADIPTDAHALPAPIIGFKPPHSKILIVDDNILNIKLLKDFLLPLGFKIATAENGREALRKAKKIYPDLILLDLVMSGTDGFGVIRNIQKIPALNDVRIIAISASVSEETQQKVFVAGFHDFIPKPVKQVDLLEKLRFHLELEWIYDVSAMSSTTPPASEQPEAAKFVIPPVQELKAIYASANTGMILELHNKLDYIEKLDASFLPFVTEIRYLVKRFQLDEICEQVTRYIGEQ